MFTSVGLNVIVLDHVKPFSYFSLQFTFCKSAISHFKYRSRFKILQSVERKMANNSSLSKVLVTNSTGLSLNERFTAISSQSAHAQAAQQRRSRSRSRSINRTLSSIDQTTSAANQHLLQELQRKHKSQAALKLKRVCVTE